MAKHYEEDLNEMEIIDDVTENESYDDHGNSDKNVPDVSSALSWLDKAATLYKKHGFIGTLKGVIFMLIAIAIAVFIYLGVSFAINPKKYIEYYNEIQSTKAQIEDARHKDLIAKRMENTPKIQSECDKLLWKTGGQRVLFLEMHNNTNNISGLPFYYADASCESLDDYSYPIAEYCKQVKLSLMPFATELFEKGSWHGSMEDLFLIDKSFYHKVKASGAEHMAAVVVQGTENEVGMLFVMYGPEDAHSCEEAINTARQTAMKLGVLVEVSKSYK